MDLKFAHFDYHENLKQQRDLFKDCFPETNGDPIQGDKHYLWKFHSFPSSLKSWEYASYIGDDMAGYYAAIPYKYKIGKRTTTVGMVCDVMTNSKFRGKGVFTKMGAYSTNELAAEVPFTMGYPIRKEVIPGHLKVGWKIPFSMPLYMKFISLNSLLKSKRLIFITPLANVFLNLYNFLLRTKYSSNYSFSLTSDINDVIDYNDFVNEWSSSVPNALMKNQEFARWRYGAPKRTYKFLSIKNAQGKIIAFVSFRKILKENVPSFGILDYMYLPGCEDSTGLIIRILTDLAKKEKVEAIMTMMSKTSASNYRLLRNGFFKSPYVFQLIIKNLTNNFNDEELFTEKNWHLMWVDSDDL